MSDEQIWQMLGTGSGRASPLNPFGLHPLPRSQLVHHPKPIADPIPMRETSPMLGFGLRPLTSPRNRPFGLGSERQLAAFIKGPHMSPAPPRFGDPFSSSFGHRGPPCYAPPSHDTNGGLPALRTLSRRGLSTRGGDTTYSSSVGASPRGHAFSPRPDSGTLDMRPGTRGGDAFLAASMGASSRGFTRPVVIPPPEEAGVGNIVNGGARSPRAFHLKHADSPSMYASKGSTPYPGVWIFPTLEPIEQDDD